MKLMKLIYTDNLKFLICKELEAYMRKLRKVGVCWGLSGKLRNEMNVMLQIIFKMFNNLINSIMAKFKKSALISEVHGKIGKVVFSSNGHGEYVKTYVKGKNPRTEIQQQNRNNFRYISKLWKTLTYSQAQGWMEAAMQLKRAHKNKTYYSTGLMYFMHTNMNLLNVDCEPLLDTPKTGCSVLSAECNVKFKVVCTSKRQDILISYAPDLGKNIGLVIYATQQTQLMSFPDTKFKKIGVLDYKSNPGYTDISIYEMYEKRFNELWQNMRIGFRVQTIDKLTGVAVWGEKVVVDF